MTGTTQLPEGVVTLEQAKKDPKPGIKFFVERTGSYGTILEEKAPNGKWQASMTCTAGGPNHIRLISDWHQCGVSPEMKKGKKKSSVSTEEKLAKAEAKRAELQAKLVDAKVKAGLPPDSKPTPTDQDVAEACQDKSADQNTDDSEE